MSASEPRWRVSVATLSRVLVQAGQRAPVHLVLERAATMRREKGQDPPVVLTKPFGGAVRILDPASLRRQIGEFEIDSPHSQAEGDFRILIPSPNWEMVKRFCLQRLTQPNDPIIETSPQRELVEELRDSLHIELQPGQFTCRPAGIVVENTPVPTGNLYSAGTPTVRIYRIYEVDIPEDSLRSALLKNSQAFSDPDLRALALADAARGGKGRANAVLALRIETITQALQAVPAPQRAGLLSLAGHLFDPSVIAILENVDAPQYERL